MATYRIFPSTNGPASVTAYTGQFISGVCFTVTTGNCWLQGYWWWVCASGQATTATKCCLWSVSEAGGGYVVPNSETTSGTLTAGAWNYIPLDAAVQLALGGTYIAAIAANGGPFPDTNDFWANGSITNGPLLAFGAQTGNAENWGPQEAVAPYNIPQGCFNDQGTNNDPSTAFPGGSSGTDNFWVDVQISTVPPGGYGGSYRLWPNRYDIGQFSGPDSQVAYTVATEVVLSRASTLDKIWYASPPGGSPGPTMATEATVWSVATQTAVADFPNLAASQWTYLVGGNGSAGGGGGWCYLNVAASNIVLPPGRYKVSVYNGNTSSSGGPGQWSCKYLYFWGPDGSSGTTGVLGGGEAPNGIASGPLFAPSPLSSPAGSLAYQYNGVSTGAPPYSNGTLMAGQSTFAMPTATTPAVVTETDAAPGNTARTTITVAPVAGHGLVLMVMSNITTTPALSSVVASNGDVWELLGSYTISGSCGDIWYCALSAGGTYNLQINWNNSSANNPRYWYQEFNCPLNLPVFYSSGSLGTTTTIGPIPYQANSLVIAAAKSPGTFPPSGMTAVGGSGSTHCGQLLATSSGTYSGSISSSTMWVAMQVLLTTGNGYPNLYVTNNIPSGNNAFTQNYMVDMEVTPVPDPALSSGAFITFFL